jgi:hypothetical protein
LAPRLTDGHGPAAAETECDVAVARNTVVPTTLVDKDAAGQLIAAASS